MSLIGKLRSFCLHDDCKETRYAAASELEAMQAEMERRGTLIRKVLDYYEGNKPFDFHRLHNDFDRSNQAFDAWQEIAGELKSALDSQGK